MHVGTSLAADQDALVLHRQDQRLQRANVAAKAVSNRRGWRKYYMATPSDVAVDAYRRWLDMAGEVARVQIFARKSQLCAHAQHDACAVHKRRYGRQIKLQACMYSCRLIMRRHCDHGGQMHLCETAPARRLEKLRLCEQHVVPVQAERYRMRAATCTQRRSHSRSCRTDGRATCRCARSASRYGTIRQQAVFARTSSQSIFTTCAVIVAIKHAVSLRDGEVRLGLSTFHPGKVDIVRSTRQSNPYLVARRRRQLCSRSRMPSAWRHGWWASPLFGWRRLRTWARVCLGQASARVPCWRSLCRRGPLPWRRAWWRCAAASMPPTRASTSLTGSASTRSSVRPASASPRPALSLSRDLDSPILIPDVRCLQSDCAG